jgi:tryptophan synthase alpha chain
MSTPLDDLFVNTRKENRAALIGFLPAGFPTQPRSISTLTAMIQGGCDAIEIGFPYSDPVMDGPIIQAASDQSLKQRTGSREVFATVKAIAPLAPTVVMTYWNPIERYGVTKFLESMKENGGSGAITPDLTIEESSHWIEETQRLESNRIFVVAPSTSDDRLKKVAEASTGFIYAASLMGVTGTRASVSTGAQTLVDRIRRITDKPVAVGLGVSTPEQAHEVAQYADGVIVGSAFIRLIQESKSEEEGISKVKNLAHALAQSMKRS